MAAYIFKIRHHEGEVLVAGNRSARGSAPGRPACPGSPGQIQDTLERFYLTAGLGMP